MPRVLYLCALNQASSHQVCSLLAWFNHVFFNPIPFSCTLSRSQSSSLRPLRAPCSSGAPNNGVVRFEAEVLPQNRAMLAVFEHSGLSPRLESEDDTLHVTMPLMNGGS